MLHTNDQVIGKKWEENGEIREKRVKSYLRGSVPVQKSLAKPAGQHRGERCQCAPAMGCNEGAGQRYSGGWRLGLTEARASAVTAKRTGGFLAAGLDGLKRLPHRADRVDRVVTWRRRPVVWTIEDPRRLRASGATGRYKAVSKSALHAADQETRFLRLLAWGSQLDQSSRSLLGVWVVKGRSSGSPSWSRSHGTVSSADKSLFGPGRASLRPNPQPAKQHSVTAASAPRRAVSTQTGHQCE